jgi:septal ring factor EnvC (AmiA/AmiB activator)
MLDEPGRTNGGKKTDDDVDELEDTGALPALEAQGDVLPRGVSRAAPASFLLSHLEGEIRQVQTKWHFVADKLRLREARIDELVREAQAKDAAAEELRRSIAELTSGKQSLQAELEQARLQIAGLVAAQSARDSELMQRTQELGRASAAAAVLEDKVAASSMAVDRLTASLDSERLATVDARRRHDEQVAANNELRITIQELETYIDGRTRSWAALNAKVAEYQDALTELRAQAELKERLTARVLELERLASQRQEQIQRLAASGAAADRALRGAEQQAATLEQQVDAYAEEVGELQDSLTAQQELVARLENDLRAKQSVLDLLERNVHRLHGLGASLAGLERELSSTSAERRGASSPPMHDEAEAPPIEAGAPRAFLENGRKMIVAVDGDELAHYLLHKTNTTIGRSAEADIRIDSRFISRVHARIFTRNADTLIEDLDSKNGVLVNSLPVDQHATLHDGDVIRLGDSLELMYVELDGIAPPNQAALGSQTIPLLAGS